MRKPVFSICENKYADQLRSNCAADQRPCFRYTDTTIPLLPKFKALAVLCSCTARFVSDLVGNPEDRFSNNEAQMILAKNHVLDFILLFRPIFGYVPVFRLPA